MAREPNTESQQALTTRIAQLEQQIETLHSALMCASDAQAAGERERQPRTDLNAGRAEPSSTEGVVASPEAIQIATKETEVRLRALLRGASDYAIIETDSDGRITFWNEGAEALIGWTEAEATGRNIEMMFTPEDREAGKPEQERCEAMANGRSDYERWHIRKDGTTFYAHERVIAPLDPERKRFLKVLRNRSKEREIEEARYASEEQMRLILNSAMDYAIFTLDRSGVVTTWNPGAERLLGYGEDEIVGRNGRIVFTPEDQATGESEKELAKALNQGRAEDERWHMRKDGSRFWGSGLMLPLQPDGIPGFLKIMRDETARHRADEMNRLLIGELNHRVKNTLGLVQAIAKETLRGRDPGRDIRDALDSRLAALSRSHDILARESWESASLTEVIRRAFAPFVRQGKVEDRLTIDGRDARLSPTAALSLGMAFHELATNAAKYGALSVPSGKVEVRWREEMDRPPDGTGLRLNWRERDGPPVSPPARKGFGSRLIERALAYEMNGTTRLDYAADGLRFELSIPKTALQGRANGP